MSQRHRRTIVGPVVALLLFLGFAGSETRPADEPKPVFDPDLYKAMKYRNIGPYRGGRVTAVTGVAGERDTFFMGSTGGGVWTTADGGETWKNVSDGQFEAGSIGAIAVAPSDPNVVYAGTGSACPRGNVSPGVGVYKSDDAGKSWKHVGLREAGQIARIRVHPTDPDTVFVAALGHIFGPHAERGVFRSKDGGESWEKVLEGGDDAGAVDLVLSPGNPRVLYAAIWQVVRKPWTLLSGGEKSGLFQSVDGGDNWNELTEGLPEGIKGRIGVAVSPANPERVWALVEAEEGGLFRSGNGGKSFQRINDDRSFGQRAWYYTHVYADPLDAETVYILNVGMWRSNDGGKGFEFIRTPHGDHHDLWINPDDPRVMINGNDGGANITLNGGESWSTQANQPTAEFYRVTVDDRFPYRVYGSQQDNSTVSIPSRSDASGITRRHWHPVGGCESGHIAVDPRDSNIVYAGCYGGSITRYDHRTGQAREILTYPQTALGQAPRDLRYRFQWNAPIRLSPHDPDVLYHASQYVHRTRDGGQSWDLISPDLSRNDVSKQDYAGGPITRDNTGVEVYGTVFALEPSPHRPGLLWAGTDDGRVHVTEDAGGQWKEITPKQMPEWAQVNSIEPSAHAAARAFLAVTRYRLDDFRPYIFRTDDLGASWKLLTDGSNGIPEDHFVRVVREDPARKGLLYAGTEFGIYVSFDDGRRWQSLQLNLPVTPVTDLAVKNGDLVVATQGRSFWILDDLTPLHQLNDELARAEAHLFQPRPVHRLPGGSGSGRSGANPPAGAVIHYVLAEEPEQEVRLEIMDAEGNILRSFSSEREEPRAPNPWERFLPAEEKPERKLKTEAGMNRWVWDLRLADAEITEGTMLWGTALGPRVPPQSYLVRLSVGDWSQSRPLRVLRDPRVEATDEDLLARFDLARKVWSGLTECHRALRRLRDVREQVGELARRLAEVGKGEGLAEAASAVRERLDAIEQTLTQPRSRSSQDVLNFPPQLDGQLLGLFGVVESADARPTDGSVERYRDLRAELDRRLAELEAVFSTEVAAFNDRVRSTDAAPVIVPVGQGGAVR